MEIYFYTYLLVGCAGLVSIYLGPGARPVLGICSLPLLLMAYQMGFRWEMGTDWNSYFNNFVDTVEVGQALLNAVIGFEPGYGLLGVLVHQFSDEYSVFLIVNAVVVYFFSFSAIRQLSPYPAISLMLFYALTIGILGSNRQLLALSICLFSIRYALSREGGKFSLAILFASTFHMSAVLFTVYYFLDREIKVSRLIMFLALAILIGGTPILTVAFESIGGAFGGIIAYKAKYYADNSNLVSDELSVSGLVRRLLMLSIFLGISIRVGDGNRIYRMLLNGYCVGIFMYFLFGRALLILVNRGSIYFNIMEAFLLVYSLVLVRHRIERYLIFFVLSVYGVLQFFQGISGYPDLFIPFQSIHINSSYQRFLY